MNRLRELFERQTEPILSIYCTACYPQLDSTIDLVKNLSNSKVDFIELGIPFSDPIADGETIQKSSTKAIENGFTMQVLMKQIQMIRTFSDVPIVLMGYLNPIHQFGMENVLKCCKRYNISGLIIPDVTLAYYKKAYQNMFESYGISFIFLVTSETKKDRLLEIDQLSTSFIYLVSSPSITGGTKNIEKDTLNQLKKVKKMGVKSPLMVGFGIHNHKTFKQITAEFDGAIIGSAFIKTLMNEKYDVDAFVDKIRKGTEGLQDN